MRDMLNHVHPITAIQPTTVADNTPWVSAIIDTSGYNSLTFLLLIGTLADADATFAVLVEDGDADDLSDAAAVPDSELIGTEVKAAFSFADDGKTRKIGYAGFKQYVRLTVTPSGNSGNATMGALALLGHPRTMPTANPPT